MSNRPARSELREYGLRRGADEIGLHCSLQVITQALFSLELDLNTPKRAFLVVVAELKERYPNFDQGDMANVLRAGKRSVVDEIYPISVNKEDLEGD